ncbi:hypothetical protein ACIG87_14205 [Micromonospora sp. NPDC051925]|uniref:hypothetical protein n=1 Tax=Micromonospora sp. NPDC051925 TaxID=3364288 RepID=UPI0037CC4A1F
MNRILGIELRRSVAVGMALTLLLVGGGILYLEPFAWAAGWMPLAAAQRQYLFLLWPLALAAGAWQARREQRSQVAELFTSTARPRVQRVAPTLAALGIAVVLGYLAMTAVAVPWIIDTASYLPAATFAVLAVGALSLVAAAWLGLAIGRLVSSPVTAPALAVAGIGLLLVIPIAFRSQKWLVALLSPMEGIGLYTDFLTVPGRTSAAQAIWLTGLAVTGVVLLAAGSRRATAMAVLPVVLGAALGSLVIPRGDDFVESSVDPVARELVCAEGTPRVCVARAHAGLLPEVTPLARQGLSLLAKLPNAPTNAAEDVTTFLDVLDKKVPPRQPADTVLFGIQVGDDGHLDDNGEFLTRMLTAGGADPYRCSETLDWPVSRAVAYWLLGREPVIDPERDDEQVHALWQGLHALPDKEATARVAAVREATLACRKLDGLLTGPTG